LGLIKGVVRDISRSAVNELNYARTRARDSILFLTYRCTSRCACCNIWKKDSQKGSELDWENWKKALDNLIDYGIKSVEIFGGDALLKKDIIFKMVEYCAKRKIKTYFPTNSILFDRETARNLVNAGLDTIYFSLDDINANVDRIRGVNNAFEKVKEALNNIFIEKKNSKTPDVIICTTISKMNYRHFEDIVAFLKDYPISAVYPRPLVEFIDEDIERSIVSGVRPAPFFVSTDNESHRLTEKEFKEFGAIAAKLKKKPGLPYINFRTFYDIDEKIITTGKAPAQRCLFSSTVVTVKPNGDVVPCLFFDDLVLGNLVRAPFADIWGCAKHRDFIKAQREKKIEICGGCVSREYYPSLGKTVKYFKDRLIEKVAGRKPMGR
jgi:Fe-coproporphyrin III synthase